MSQLATTKNTASFETLSSPAVHLCADGTDVATPRKVDLTIDADDDLERLVDEDPASLAERRTIAIAFHALTDGRGYSQAQRLRRDFGFTGEIRAVGDVGIDQLHYLARAGFDTFVLREGTDRGAAIAALQRFSHFYVGVNALPGSAALTGVGAKELLFDPGVR